MSTERCDVVVVGGGPAGATVACLVKRYAPDARVVLLEKESFPRHHVGESLLPALIPVLREMGVHDRIAAAGFVRKVGVTFVWGRDRRPWDGDFSALKMELARRGEDVGEFDTTWQVPRARYDAFLLERARELGVEILSGARASAPLLRGEAVTGLRYALPDGSPRELRSRFLVDCSGQSGFLSRYRPVRRGREDLKNVAVYGYFRGAPWKFRYTGTPNASRIFVCSAPEGWFWYIPIARDLVSVGLVAKADYVAARGVKDMRAFFMGALARRPELSGLLRGRPLVRGMDPAAPEKDLFTVSDWSYESVSAAGPGWYAAGDAAFFIDPLLSSGVMMAHLSGQRCAYAVLAELSRRGGAAAARAVREDYAAYCRHVGTDFLELVRIWYAHEPSAKKWFEAARRRGLGSGPMKLSDRGAFLSLITGLNRRLDRAYLAPGGTVTNARGHAWRLQRDRDSATALLFLTGGGTKEWRRSGPSEEAGPADRAVRAVRLVGRRREGTGFVPIEGSGRTGAVRRVELGPARERIFRLLPSVFATILDAFVAGRSPVEAAALAAERHALPLPVVTRQALALADDLALAGALRFAAARRFPSPPRWRGPLADLRRAEEALARGDARAAEAAADRCARGRGGAWALAVRGLAREALGSAALAAADLDAAVKAAGAPSRRPAPRSVAALRAEFEADVESGWLEAAILEARVAFHDRRGQEDSRRLRGVEKDPDSMRGTRVLEG